MKVLSDPQALNYYSYSGNNPIRYNDPTGETKTEAAWGWAKGVGKAVWGTLTMSYNSLVYPNETRTALQQKAKEAVNAWRETISGVLSNPSKTASEVLQGIGISYDEFSKLSDEQQGEVIGRLTEGAMEIVTAKKLGEASRVKSSTFSDDFGKLDLSKYNPTQETVNPNIVKGYYDKIKAGKKLDPIQVARGGDGQMYILNGHHRYLAAKEAGVNIDVQIVGTGPTGLSWDKVQYENFTLEN